MIGTGVLPPLSLPPILPFSAIACSHQSLVSWSIRMSQSDLTGLDLLVMSLDSHLRLPLIVLNFFLSLCFLFTFRSVASFPLSMTSRLYSGPLSFYCFRLCFPGLDFISLSRVSIIGALFAQLGYLFPRLLTLGARASGNM